MIDGNGSRKVLLTKWGLIIYSIVTIGYMLLAGFERVELPESFYMNAVIALSAITGGYTVGNIFEHKYKKEGRE